MPGGATCRRPSRSAPARRTHAAPAPPCTSRPGRPPSRAHRLRVARRPREAARRRDVQRRARARGRRRATRSRRTRHAASARLLAGLEVGGPGLVLDAGLAPRRPDWSAAAVARSSGGPNSTRHSTSHPGPGGERQQPPSSSGTRPSAPATLTWRTRAPRSGSAASWSCLDGTPARRRRVVAGRPRGDGHRLEVGGWHGAGSVLAAHSRQMNSAAVVGNRRGKRHDSPPPWRSRLDPAAHLAQRRRRAARPRRRPRGTCASSRRAARSAPRRSRSARSGCRARRAPGPRSCRCRAGRRSQGRAVHGQVCDLLRDRPVQVAGVRARDHRAVQLDLERDVERPGLLAQVGSGGGSCGSRGHARARELRERHHPGEIDVANDLPRNGPSGWYSQAWMSRADQSFSSTTPNMWSSARSIGTGSPIGLGTPTTKPTSSSMSSRRLGPKLRRRAAARSAAGPACRSHHRARPPVVADRQVAPVRQQRLGVGPEHPAEVRGVVERRVEVDVVRDLERQPSSRRRRSSRPPPSFTAGPPGADLRPAAISSVERPGVDTGSSVAQVDHRVVDARAQPPPRRTP